MKSNLQTMEDESEALKDRARKAEEELARVSSLLSEKEGRIESVRKLFAQVVEPRSAKDGEKQAAAAARKEVLGLRAEAQLKDDELTEFNGKVEFFRIQREEFNEFSPVADLSFSFANSPCPLADNVESIESTQTPFSPAADLSFSFAESPGVVSM